MHSYEYERVNPLISNGNCGDTLYGEHFHLDFLFNRNSSRSNFGSNGRWRTLSLKAGSWSPWFYHQHFSNHSLPDSFGYGFTSNKIFGKNNFGTECHYSSTRYCGSTLYCQNGGVFLKGSGCGCD